MNELPVDGLCVLTGHDTQCAWPVALLYVPAGQSTHKSATLPTMLLYLPTGHTTHSEEGGLVPYVPAGQGVHELDPMVEK